MLGKTTDCLLGGRAVLTAVSMGVLGGKIDIIWGFCRPFVVEYMGLFIPATTWDELLLWFFPSSLNSNSVFDVSGADVYANSSKKKVDLFSCEKT